MKKSLYFIALIGALLMFLLFPVVSNAVLSGYTQSTNYTFVQGLWNTTDDFGATDCVQQIFFGTYPDDSSMQANNGPMGCSNLYQSGVWNAYVGVGDYFLILRTDDNSIKKYYGPLTCTSSGSCTIAPRTGWVDYPAPVGIFLTSPASASTITDDTTELVGTWSGINSDIWTDLKIAFNDLQIGETSKIVYVPITADSGSFSITLSDFEITKNGVWTLTAIFENQYEYNFDIANPIYALTFNITGLPTPYAFTDFDDWYTANVENYETPSAWASSMIGFLQPIFEKVGEYGNRIENYLDISEAYDKGFSIGGVFPVVIAYVEKIDLFFGGFPITQFFKWIIIAMIGLFGVKAILKLLSFIPFFGGSG